MTAIRTVTVTGGAGYLGSHLVRQLLAAGYEVRVIDNFDYGDAGLRDIVGTPNLTVHRGDICNIRDLVKVVKGSQAVIALAAIVGDPACALREDETLSVNYEATKILVELCNAHEVSRLLFASSCSVYGANSQLMLNEGSWLNPVSLYAQTRIMSEELVLAKSLAPLTPTIFRMATLYGQSPRMRYDLSVNILSARAAREGRVQIFGSDQWRPFVHVRDAAAAFVLALQSDATVLRHEIFNLGSNQQNYTIAGVADMLREAVPNLAVEQHAERTDRRDYRVSFDKIEHLLGFVPKYTMSEGIREMMQAAHATQVDLGDDIYYNVKYLYRDLKNVALA